MSCCICLESFENKNKNTVNLSCGHTFHLICIAKYDFTHFWSDSEEPIRCPLCRANVSKEESTLFYTTPSRSELVELRNHYNNCVNKWIIRQCMHCEDTDIDEADLCMKKNMYRFANMVTKSIKVTTRDMRTISVSLNLTKGKHQEQQIHIRDSSSEV